MSGSSRSVNDNCFNDLRDEIDRAPRLMKIEEAESEGIAQRTEIIHPELHSSDNLCAIPEMGELTAPVFLEVAGDPMCFRNQSALVNYN